MADDDEYVDIVHPDTHGTARVTQEAFDMVWSKTQPTAWKKATEGQIAAEEKKAERNAARREG